MKTIDTLVADMHEVIKGEGGWSGVVGSTLGTNISQAANQRFKLCREPAASGEEAAQEIGAAAGGPPAEGEGSAVA